MFAIFLEFVHIGFLSNISFAIRLVVFLITVPSFAFQEISSGRCLLSAVYDHAGKRRS